MAPMKIDPCDAAKDLERLLFMMRNGKVKAFACVALLDNGQMTEIINIPTEYRLGMIGCIAVLQSEAQTLVDVADLSKGPMGDDYETD